MHCTTKCMPICPVWIVLPKTTSPSTSASRTYHTSLETLSLSFLIARSKISSPPGWHPHAYKTQLPPPQYQPHQKNLSIDLLAACTGATQSPPSLMTSELPPQTCSLYQLPTLIDLPTSSITASPKSSVSVTLPLSRTSHQYGGTWARVTGMASFYALSARCNWWFKTLAYHPLVYLTYWSYSSCTYIWFGILEFLSWSISLNYIFPPSVTNKYMFLALEWSIVMPC